MKDLSLLQKVVIPSGIAPLGLYIKDSLSRVMVFTT